MELLALGLVVLAAIPATVFPFVYGWAARSVWWKEPTGRALMVSATALALLLDLTLVFRVAPVGPRVGLLVSVVVVGLIAVGAWLKLGALIHELREGRKSVPPIP